MLMHYTVNLLYAAMYVCCMLHCSCTIGVILHLLHCSCPVYYIVVVLDLYNDHH